MRAAIICLGLALVLAGCGSSAHSGTTVAPRPQASRAVLLQRDLERDYDLHSARCEQDVHGGLRDRFVCLAVSKSIPLELTVTQARPGSRPVVTACEGARKIRGKSFVICGFKPRPTT